MAATNFTPIILYHTTTASAAPTAGNLNNGELAINITDGKLFYKDNGGTVQVIATKGTGTIGGSNTQVQYNSSGALAGSANFTFNGTTATINTLNLTNALGTAYGGTALTTYTQGDLVYASAANTLAKLGIGANTYILTSTGSVPQWSAPSAITVSTATNLAGGAAGSVPYQSGASTTTFLSIGSAGQVLTSSGSAPQWSNLSSLGVTSLSFGTTGLTPSTATQGAITVAGTLATTNGGTGLTSFTANGVVYASSSSALATGSALTFDGTTLATTGKFGITGNGSLPTATALQIGTNGVGSRWVYNAPSGGEHDFAINGVNIAYVSGTSFGTLNVDATIYGVTVGRGAGAVSTNTAVGASALTANTTGVQNTGAGAFALQNFVAGYNTAFGAYALTGIGAGASVGQFNVGVGVGAGTAITSGSGNTFLGMYAGASTTTGSSNVAIGGNGTLGTLGTNTTGGSNTAVGLQALGLNTTGSNNSAIGFQSLYSNTTASNNTAVGYQAGYYNTTGVNTFVGSQAGYSNSTGTYNTFIGGWDSTSYGAGGSTTTGGYNTALGAGSLAKNTTASNNTAVGYQSLYSNTTGANSTAVGFGSAYSNTTGTVGAFGLWALRYNTTGTNNAFGFQALTTNTTGTNNSAFGYNALALNTTGNYNVAYGDSALQSNTTASNNTAVGYFAGYTNTTGTNLTALGQAALVFNTTGSQNVAVGNEALRSNTTASNNTAVGYQAGYSNTTGTINNFFGFRAGYNTTTGGNNTGIAQGSLQSNTTGASNVAVGTESLFNSTTASANTAVGYQAGYSNQSGEYNTYLGWGAGRSHVNTTTSGSVMIGAAAGYNATTGGNNTFIGVDSGGQVTTGSKNSILGRYNGNQGGLDIRTANNYIVLSDGDGNPRGYYNSAASVWNLGGGRTVIGPAFIADNAALGNNIGFAFGGASIFPCDGSGTLTNQTTNLGDSSYRYAVAHVTGVNFPATQVASANANTLDDYEEGSWTPALSGAGSPTYTENYGRYIKIGRLVTLTGKLAVTGVTSSANTITVTGLPFSVQDAADGAQRACSFISGDVQNMGSYVASAALRTTSSELEGVRDNGSGSTVYWAYNELSSTSFEFSINVTYLATA